jgi:hypothetical protein
VLFKSSSNERRKFERFPEEIVEQHQKQTIILSNNANVDNGACFLTKEILAKELYTKELLTKKILTKELLTKELLTKELLTKEHLTNELLTKEHLTNELLTKMTF